MEPPPRLPGLNRRGKETRRGPAARPSRPALVIWPLLGAFGLVNPCRRGNLGFGAAFPARGPMRLSRYFLPIARETPKEAEIASHRLMLRAGMIRQEAAGIYAWLPLGLRVLKKIGQIGRGGQNQPGGSDCLVP